MQTMTLKDHHARQLRAVHRNGKRLRYGEDAKFLLAAQHWISLTSFIQANIFKNAKAHGFHEKDPTEITAVLAKIALIHSEVAEGTENVRAGYTPDDKIPEFKGVEAELADAIIRIFDLAEANRWRVAEAVIAKMAFNKTRPYKHGKLA